MTGYDDELGENDYLDDQLMEEFEPQTTESGDLVDDSNPFGYHDEDEQESDEEEDLD